MQHGSEIQEQQLSLAQIEASHALDYEHELASVQESIEEYNLKFEMIRKLTNCETLEEVVRHSTILL